MNRVLEHYKNEVMAKLTEQFGYTTVMQVPKIDKIVVNMGVGDSISNSKLLDAAVEDLTQITGQKPLVTKAKNQLPYSNFVRVCQLVQKLLYVAKECMNSMIN